MGDDRAKSPSRSKSHKEKDRDRGREKDRDNEREKDRDRSRDKDKDRSKDKERDRGSSFRKDKDRSFRDDGKDKDKDKDRERSKDRHKDKDKDDGHKDKDKDRPRSKDREHSSKDKDKDKDRDRGSSFRKDKDRSFRDDGKDKDKEKDKRQRTDSGNLKTKDEGNKDKPKKQNKAEPEPNQTEDETAKYGFSQNDYKPNGGSNTNAQSTNSLGMGSSAASFSNTGENSVSWRPKTCKDLMSVAFLSVLSALPVLVFVLTFSDLGWGADVFKWLKERDYLSSIFLGGAFLILLVLYILDVSYWEGFWRKQRYVWGGMIVTGIALGCLFAANDYPAAPMCLYVVGSPAFFVLLRKKVYNKHHNVVFFGAMSIALTLTGVIAVGIFLGWIIMGSNNFWPGDNNQLKHDYNVKMSCSCVETVTINNVVTNCTASVDADYLECCYNKDCLAAYLLWFSPFVGGIVCLVFGLLAYFLSRTMAQPSTIHPGLKVFGMVITITILGMWVAASVAGAGMQLSNAVLMLSFVSVGMIGAAVVSAVGWETLKRTFMSIPLVRRIMDSFLSDWVKALFMITASPLFLIYLIISTLNQFTRKKFSCTKTLDEKEMSLYLTLISHQQLKAMKSWAWSSVLVKVIYWGLIFLLLSVGISKITTLFLSWLNEVLIENFSLAMIVVIFVIVGLVMFLLPPVPGVPVYLTGGVVLVNAGRADFGFWGATFASSVICFLIKLMAIACQQKLIGERMSGSVKIRYMVGVNSITIQAIRKILEAKGMSWSKVFILCGGPDWPTSVLTGILRLSVIEMLIGSLPVYFLVVPCVCAGAFLLRANDGGVWASVGAVTISVAALVQTGAMIAAMYVIEQVADKHKEELLERCNDTAVAELEERDKTNQKIYRSVTDWHKPTFPKAMKLVLVLGSLCMGAACWIVQMYGSSCFEPYEITDTIKDKLDNNVLNLVKYMGWCAIGLMVAGYVLLKIFTTWAKKQLKQERSKLTTVPV